MTTRTLMAAVMLSVVFLGAVGSAGTAFAAYLGNVGAGGETGQNTLEEILEIQQRRIQAVQDNPGAGSGTPYLDADGVVGATVISAAVFGGIAGALFLRGRSGKYAAMGRG
ncbi:conserved exported hypothetical protein [Nitrosopumilaceae archaeon]|nr:hypothetical protein [Nitrosopumilus sp.]CAI9831580.1 conserved exported hypothetical protein [Nitrosopumilaceae archaeon]MDA7941547.1 hypothetical protein [Nitrosopumilus sp.]MDA7943600.1 hypothetical protein [Nitrosopumilus sp.]MDA7945593.1 hypothetical protein [Nitrosopumilus sp.]